MTISNQRNIQPPLFFNNIHLSETDAHKHLGLIFRQSLLVYSHSPPSSERDDKNFVFAHFLIHYRTTLSLLSTKHTYDRFLMIEALLMTTALKATSIC